MEQWDLYDNHRQKTGETMARGGELPQGRYHLVVHLCIFNGAGQMLIQQRQPFKQGWPNRWDVSVGGSAVQGEDSQTAMSREAQEELGLSLSFQHTRPHLTLCRETCFNDYYLLNRELCLDELTLQPAEVQAARWASEEEITGMIADGRFIPYEPAFIHLLFCMHNHRDAHIKGS